MKQVDEVHDIMALAKLGIQIDQKLNEIKAKIIPLPKL
jgi:hypothetical protein